MIRLAAVVAIWVVLLGGTWVYLRLTESRPGHLPIVQDTAMASGFRAELTPTFAAMPDPFALRLDGDASVPVLVARLNGNEVLRVAENLAAGDRVHIDPLPSVRVGANELFIEAAPPGEEALQAHALRVTVWQGDRLVADETLWSEPGASLMATVPFEASAIKDASDEH